MRIKILQESKPYSFLELRNYLELDNKKAKETLKSLSLMNIVKKLSKNMANIELEELLEVESLEEVNRQINGTMYIFKFVGMLTVGNCCLILYPKYIKNIRADKNNNYKKLKQIIEVIRKYKEKEQNQSFNEELDVTRFNLLSLTLDLIYNYHENGIYSNNKTVIEENGFGEILWNKTIEESNIYFSDNIPIYLDVFTMNEEINEDDLFSRLHKCILTSSCEEVKDLLNILDITPIKLSAEKLDDFGDVDYLTYRIDQELNQQFITGKQKILHMIKNYINRNDNSDSSDRISFVGTNHFNLVWEDVCSVVMGNCLNKTLKELNLDSYKGISRNSLLKDIIPKPKWTHIISKKEYYSNKTLTPDLVVVNEDGLSIYDAKYYNIQLDGNGLKHQPGVGDITKQYLYELAYKRLVKENNIEIKNNAFLMPTDSKEEAVIGFTNLDIFNQLDEFGGLNDIKVILKPCEIMFNRYLQK
ncbi:Restriction endonuclease [[Clostridium] sordellii]|uniref:LlaJI family restriction endonuclease n=1 Tax=Paraclostridium sordellii TaxID=1505 RepID=UPI0005E8C2A1|nr:LlaJI family restriction endonuclease [Paeniclostridium sordellii]CEQ11095.1 Restriction endonuclease [[Clostridium] sordellii] [Paeniclostridium sordellii]